MRSISSPPYTPIIGARENSSLGSSLWGLRCGNSSRVKILSSIAISLFMGNPSSVSTRLTIGIKNLSSRTVCSTGGVISAGMDYSVSSIRPRSVRWISSMRRTYTVLSDHNINSSGVGHGDVPISNLYFRSFSRMPRFLDERRYARHFTLSITISFGQVDHLCSSSSGMFHDFLGA